MFINIDSKGQLAQRFLMAISGTAGVALSSFILAALLLKTVTPAQFGIYSFIQVVIALGYGVSNALLGSPLLVALNRTEYIVPGTAESYFKANFWISLVAAFPVWVIVFNLGESKNVSSLFAVAAVLMWTRWFGRSYANAMNEPARTAVSDICYTIVVIAGAILLFIKDSLNFKTVPILLLCGAGLGILALGQNSLTVQVSGIWRGKLTSFYDGFRGQGRYALVGVLTTEAANNAHSYIVALLLGPVAFAPLAASRLLFRPVQLVILSLIQLERPRISKLLGSKQIKQAMHAIRAFRYVALGCWVANILVAYVIIVFFHEMVIDAGYDLQVIIQATLFWCVIMGLRSLRGAEIALVQANGNFKELAKVTMVSSIVTLPLVLGLVYFFGAVWSLGGIVMGDIVTAVLILKLSRITMPPEGVLE